MKTRLDARTTTLAAGSALALTALFQALAGCSDGDAPSLQPEGDGGSMMPSSDGAPDDGGPLADARRDGDAALPICSTDGFCHSTLPDGEDLASVWGDGEGIVWAVSFSGDVLRWDGTSWKIVHQIGSTAYAIWGSGPTDLWIGAETGLVHGRAASPGSIVFEPVDAPGDPSVPITSIWGAGPDDVWAVGGVENWDVIPMTTKGRVLHLERSDGGTGTEWRSDDDLASRGIAFRAVWGSAATGVWIHGIRPDDPTLIGRPFAHVFHRPKHASTWSSVALPSDPDAPFHPFPSQLVGTNTIADTTVWLAGLTGMPTRGIWRGTSSDGGETFTWTFTGRSKWDRMPFAYWGSGPDDVWEIGETGLVSHWDGTAWKQAIIRTGNVPVAQHLRAVWGKDSSDFWIVGEGIALHRTSMGKP